MRNRPIFLQWALFNSLAIVVLVVLGVLGFASGVSGIPLVVTGVILAVGVIVSGYAGWLSWRADGLAEFNYETPTTRQVLHDANHVFHAIWLAQVLGIIGALSGYRELAKTAATSTDVTAAIHSVFAGLGSGLTATLAGVLVSLLFFAESRLLEQRLANKL